MAEELSRKDFLGFVLGAGAVAGCGAAAAGPEKKQGTVIAITHGLDHPDRVMIGMAMATKLPEGEDNHVWFATYGGPVCKKEEAAKLSSPLFKPWGTAAETFDKLKKQGVHIHI